MSCGRPGAAFGVLANGWVQARCGAQRSNVACNPLLARYFSLHLDKTLNQARCLRRAAIGLHSPAYPFSVLGKRRIRKDVEYFGVYLFRGDSLFPSCDV